MLFAFAAASSLFDASVRWEAESGNLRRAGMVAEKKMEELRTLTADVPAGRSFSDVLNDHLGPQAEYPEAPGFTIQVSLLSNSHGTVPTSGLTPLPGVHSPCSAMFTKTPTLADNPPDGNPQLNNRYRTYPYTRHIPDSLKMVEVRVEYGANTQPVRLVSLLGDPITPLAAGASAPRVVVTKESGPSTLNDFDISAIYSAQVVTSTGSEPKDVTILWGLSLTSTGSLTFLPLDSSGRRVQVTRRRVTPIGAGATARAQAYVRYGGQEASGESAAISLP